MWATYKNGFENIACGLDWSGSELGPLEGLCQNSIGHFGFCKTRTFFKLNLRQILTKTCHARISYHCLQNWTTLGCRKAGVASSDPSDPRKALFWEYFTGQSAHFITACCFLSAKPDVARWSLSDSVRRSWSVCRLFTHFGWGGSFDSALNFRTWNIFCLQNHIFFPCNNINIQRK